MRLFWLLLLSTSSIFSQADESRFYNCVCENIDDGSKKLQNLEQEVIANSLLISNSSIDYKQFFLKGNSAYYDSFDKYELAKLKESLEAFFTSELLLDLRNKCFLKDEWASIEATMFFRKIKEVDGLLIEGKAPGNKDYSSIEDFWNGEFKTQWFESNDTKVLLYYYLCTQYCGN